MSDPQSDDEQSLPIELKRQVDAICNRFEAACKDGLSPRIDNYLGEVPETARAFLSRELEQLQAYYSPRAEQAKTPVGPPTAEFSGTASFHPTPEATGTVIAGRYKLLQKLGEGGMGTVYMAEQQEPVKRRVALKIIKAGMDSAQVIARFEQERQALAMMDHPNIAKVLDAGTTGPSAVGWAKSSRPTSAADEKPEEQMVGREDLAHPTLAAGRPFFVMELVKGIPITKFCDQEHLTPRERLELFIPVCQAVQHAHQKGIIHRDLKPSNVLIALYDGRPVPKVIDFGVAKATSQKLTERTMFTEVGQIVGTLEYMAPEQAELNNLDIDTRADIYSLGVILYELLTGSPPFTSQVLRSAAFTEMLRLIREVEPPKPSTKLSSSAELPSIAAQRKLEPKRLTKMVSGELDWITMKCLEKDRARRYETANGLAMEVQRYLADEPVLAGPPSLAYRMRKFVRRNKGPVLAASLVFLALVGGMAGTIWGLVEANRARRQAEFERDEKDQARRLADQRRTEAETARQSEAEQRLAAEAAEHAARESEADTKAFSSFLIDDVLIVARPEGERGGLGINVTVRQALDEAAKQIAERFRGRPRAEAIARHDLGITFRLIGDLEAAETMLREALRLREQTLGPDDSDTLKTQNSLAVLLRVRGKFAEAIPLFEEALKRRKATLGPDHPETLTSINNLAGTYQDVGRLHDALPMHEEALKLQKSMFGVDHPDTVASMSNLARAYLSADRVQEALSLYEQTVKLRKTRLGPDHPDTLSAMRGLAGAYHAAGRLQDVLALCEETLKLAKGKLGPDHPDTLTSMNDLAVAYRVAGRLSEALPLIEETLKLRKAKLGPDHPYTLQSMNTLAMQYRAAGRLSETLPLFEETLELRKATLGAKHPETLKSMNYLAEEYHAASRLPEALPLYEETLTLMKANLGPDHPDTLLTMGNLARAYLDTKQPEQAIPLLADFLAGKRKRLGPEDPALAAILTLVGQALLKHEQYVEAEKVLRECLVIRAKTEADAWTTFHTKSLLGGSMLGQKNYAAAEPLLLNGYEGMKERGANIPPLGKPCLTEAVERLVQLYDAWGKPDQAGEWRAKLEAMKGDEKK